MYYSTLVMIGPAIMLANFTGELWKSYEFSG